MTTPAKPEHSVAVGWIISADFEGEDPEVTIRVPAGTQLGHWPVRITIIDHDVPGCCCPMHS